MRLRLRILSRKVAGRGQSRRFVFAVVDLDKADSYPQNFVCLLPQLGPAAKYTSVFQKIFGDRSLSEAKKLLTKALRDEDNPDVRAEIEKRLKALRAKPAVGVGRSRREKKV